MCFALWGRFKQLRVIWISRKSDKMWVIPKAAFPFENFFFCRWILSRCHWLPKSLDSSAFCAEVETTKLFKNEKYQMICQIQIKAFYVRPLWKSIQHFEIVFDRFYPLHPNFSKFIVWWNSMIYFELKFLFLNLESDESTIDQSPNYHHIVPRFNYLKNNLCS